MDQEYKYIKDKKLIPYIDRDTIQNKVKQIAQEISQEYHDKKPIFIGVLNGAFLFMADLIRYIDTNIPFQVDFIKLSSYEGEKSTGIVKALSGLKNDVKDRHIIIVEDIIETGLTIQNVVEELQKKQPASVKVCSCFLKLGKLKTDIKIDYLVKEVEDYFVIGYGLDWDEYGRGYDCLYKLE